ncbi:hypothetical protein IGX29_04575, partial [Streptomyces sp. H28]|uniref:hypothetical protein n=1 Tax=Streptomyces sp. H28 TaxID=2775865 RepID=UPI0019AD07A0
GGGRPTRRSWRSAGFRSVTPPRDAGTHAREVPHPPPEVRAPAAASGSSQLPGAVDGLPAGCGCEVLELGEPALSGPQLTRRTTLTVRKGSLTSPAVAALLPAVRAAADELTRDA